LTKSTAPGYTDTPIDGVSALWTGFGVVNWAADFRVLPSDGTGEVSVINTTTPVDQPETFRFAQKVKKDIYAGTDIDASAKLGNTSGLSTLIELRQVHSVTESTDAAYRKLVPIRVGITIDSPRDANFTKVQVLNMVKRALAGIHSQGVYDDFRINDLLHGVLKPKTVIG